MKRVIKLKAKNNYINVKVQVDIEGKDTLNATEMSIVKNRIEENFAQALMNGTDYWGFFFSQITRNK